MIDLSITLAGIPLKNPVITASGTFGYGKEFNQLIDLDALGGLMVKGLSIEPISGNAPPRLHETPSGMLNAIGLQNVGVHRFVREKLPRLASLTGGLSGPTIKPVAVRMVYQVVKAVRIPVIGIGGIRTAEGALEFLLVGARCVQIGTANFLDPQAPIKVIKGLKKFCQRKGIQRIGDIIGRMKAG